MSRFLPRGQEIQTATVETFRKFNATCGQMWLNRFFILDVCFVELTASSIIFFCFTRMCMQCDCSILTIVATSRSCINMPSERDVPHDFSIAHTQQPQQLNSIMPRSSEERRRQPVATWKTISVRRLTCVGSKAMVRPERGKRRAVVEPVFSLLRDATNPSLLPPSVHFINFRLNIPGLKYIHGPLHTRDLMGFIKNE